MAPGIRRVSSGRSGVTEGLSERLLSSGYFEDVIHIEGRHTIVMTPERYISAWRSVNDVQAQMGSLLFERFLGYIETLLRDVRSIEATYLTRSWSVRRKE